MVAFYRQLQVLLGGVHYRVTFDTALRHTQQPLLVPLVFLRFVRPFDLCYVHIVPRAVSWGSGILPRFRIFRA